MASIIILDTKDNKIFGTMIHGIDNNTSTSIKKLVIDFLYKVATDQAVEELDLKVDEEYSNYEQDLKEIADSNLEILKNEIMWVESDDNEAELASASMKNDKASSQLYDQILKDLNAIKYFI